MKKIAFCFLIYDMINQEELWNIFFKNIDPEKYRIYIHYKTNRRLKYFEKYKLQSCIETKYADKSLTLAGNLLFREAFQDSDNFKFILISGSCVPFKSFDTIYEFLINDHYGYLNTCPQEQCFPNCNSLLSVIEKPHIGKAHQWIILNRLLVEKLCFDKDHIINTIFSSIYAPEEYFYYTYIKILGLEDEVKTTVNAANEATTITNWAGMDYKYVTNRSIKNYTNISQEEIEYLLKSPCLFGRKFLRECINCFINKPYITSISSNNESNNLRKLI
jgi:hypothetical protein